MRTLLILSVVGMGTFPALARAESTPEQITESIDKLASKRPVAREQAMKVLEFAGEPALEALRKAAQSDDLDVSRRAISILFRIEKELENRKYVEVARHDFKFDDETLHSVVNALNRKLKTQLFLDDKLVSNRKRTVTFEVKAATAFETITKFMEVAGLKESDNPTLKPNSGESRRINGGLQIWGNAQGYGNPQPIDYTRLVLMDGKSDLPSVNSGPLRIRVLAQGKDQAVRTGGSNEIGIKLDVCPITPATWRGLLGIDIRKAIDENGQNLTQSYLRETPSFNPYYGDDAIFINGGMQQFQQLAIDSAEPQTGMYNPRHLPVTFFTGKKPSRTLKELEGVIHSRTMTPSMTLLLIDDVSKVSPKATFKSGNLSLQILEVQLQAKKGQEPFIRYRMTTTNPNQNDFVGQFGGLMMIDEMVPGMGQPQVSIRDASNATIRTTLELLGQPNNDGFTQICEYQLKLSAYSAAKVPLKIVVTGQKEVEISVPFSLKNIQLP